MENMHLVAPNNRVEETSQTRVEETDFERFMSRATKMKEQQAASPITISTSWADPDPAAISRVSEAKHPVTALIERRRGNELTAKQRFVNIRWTCAVLQAVEPKSLTWDQVMNYPWHHVDADMASTFYRYVRERYPHAPTRRHRVVLLRSIVDTCFRAKLISAARRAEVLEELPAPSRYAPKFRGVRITDSQLQALLGACAIGEPREAALISAIVAVFSTTGARISEMVAFDLGDWDRDRGFLHMQMTKNGKPHSVPVHPSAQAYLSHWFDLRGDLLGPLFTREVNGEAMRLRTYQMRALVQNRAIAAGIGHLGTHDFRRTIASTLLRTHDAALVSRLLNHSSLSATLVYDLATEEEQQNAISSLKLPMFVLPSEVQL